MNALNPLTQQYLEILQLYLQGDEPAAFEQAYELGRAAVSEGAVPMVSAVHEALEELLATDELAEPSRAIQAAAAVLTESMAVVEMALRGYREANSRLHAEIREHQQTQRQLEQAREQADAANRAKSEFLASMSHEIRTPMNGIIGMTELALGTQLTDEQREYLSLVKTSAEALLSVINDILDFSKIEARRLELEQIDFLIRPLLGDVVKTLALRAEQKHLELACQIAADVPPGLVGDPGRLRQILVNLLGNAVKFTDQGEVVLRVRREGQTRKEVELHFEVSDTGIGISPAQQQVVFDPFRQAESSTTRRYGGTGLGLSISSQLVQLMGGRIWVESNIGHGSTFHFTARFALSHVEASQAPARDAAQLAGLDVLIVDDNATNRRILQDITAGWEMHPMLAETGRDALQILHQAARNGQPIPLLLLDAHLEDMEGIAVAEDIQRSPRLCGMAIVMLTSASQPGDIARCQQQGVQAHLMKPVMQSELLEAMLAALGKTRHGKVTVDQPAVAPLRTLHVLLVEDNLINQKLAWHLLEKEGHRVRIADDGQAALDAVQQEKFDLVLMDVEMPGMDGLQATAAIRQQEQGNEHIPIIAMTAHALKGDRERCLAAGMDDYVSKPIRRMELSEAISRVLENAAAASAGMQRTPRGAGDET